MSVITRVTLTTESNGVNPTGFTTNSDAPTMFRKLADLVGAVAGGGRNGRMILAHAPIAAQAKLTVTGTGTDGDTITVAGIVITMKTSGASPALNEVNIGGSVTAVADQVRALINGTTALSPNSWAGICSATNVAGVITLTAYLPGTMGNGLALAENSSSVTLSNAFGSLTAGTEGTKATYKVGL